MGEAFSSIVGLGDQPAEFPHSGVVIRSLPETVDQALACAENFAMYAKPLFRRSDQLENEGLSYACAHVRTKARNIYHHPGAGDIPEHDSLPLRQGVSIIDQQVPFIAGGRKARETYDSVCRLRDAISTFHQRYSSLCSTAYSPMRKDRKLFLPVDIRWMIRRDMPEVLRIGRRSFQMPWSEEEYIECLRQRNNIGMVAEHEERVIGFMIYELRKQSLGALNMGVDEPYRRLGIGTQLLTRLVRRLSFERRTRLDFEIDELNLPMQLFLRANSLRTESIDELDGEERYRVGEGDSDAVYPFRYHVRPSPFQEDRDDSRRRESIAA